MNLRESLKLLSQYVCKKYEI